MEPANDAGPDRSDSTFAPFFGMARTWLAREGFLRGFMAPHIQPAPHDLVVDMQCGGGNLARRLSEIAPDARVIGACTDATAIARAQGRTPDRGPSLRYICATAEDIAYHLGAARADKVIVTLTDTHNDTEKLHRLRAAFGITDPRGAVFVIGHNADRATSRNVRRAGAHAFAVLAASPGADVGTSLIRVAGFVAVEEIAAWSTPFGAVSLLKARAS